MKVLSRMTDGPAEHECFDRVTVIVVASLLVFFVIRGAIPAVIDGKQVGMALAATGLAAVALAFALLPAWLRRRARRASDSAST
jgi:heme A synthase